MHAHPVKLELAPGALQIVWSDGQVREYLLAQLRKDCPCATCREKREATAAAPPTLLPVLRPEETRPLTIDKIHPVGNYAYSIHFSDGHDTGIYTIDLLRGLGKPLTV
jgi:DUF971 family protein